MRLSEDTEVPNPALPVAALKEHLRLGTGFAMAPDQDELLQSYLRAALAVIEQRTGKALFERGFHLVLARWRDGAEQALPLAPVARIDEVRLVDAAGDARTVSPTLYRLVRDGHRPRIAGRGGMLPTIPTDGQVEITFDAGFGPAWDDIPADLRQAVLLLAAEYYEHRHDDAASRAGLPHGVAALIESWRLVRVLGGGRR